ncbi:MAG: 50S ribosomal protein L21e [Thermoplasmatales archaeon]
MAKMSHGPRAKTRSKLRKKGSEKAPLTVNRLIRKFDIGDRVAIDIEPSVHDGMPFKRFQGLTGIVESKRGDAYIIGINDQGKRKSVISYPVHLKRV